MTRTKKTMFSHTSRPRSRIWGTSVRKHCFCFCGLCYFHLFFCFSFVFIGFSMVLGLFLWFLLVIHWFSLVLQWFWTVFDGYCLFSMWFCSVLGGPLWIFIVFYGFCIGFERKAKGQLLENQSQPTPGPLRSFLLGLSLLCLLWGSFSGTSPESLLVVWPPPGSSRWLWSSPSRLCLLLHVISKK